jgi:hypothetical protein
LRFDEVLLTKYGARAVPEKSLMIRYTIYNGNGLMGISYDLKIFSTAPFLLGKAKIFHPIFFPEFTKSGFNFL